MSYPSARWYAIPTYVGNNIADYYAILAEVGNPKVGQYVTPVQVGNPNVGQYTMPMQVGNPNTGWYTTPSQVGNPNIGWYVIPAQVGNPNAGWYIIPEKVNKIPMIYRSMIDNKTITKYAEVVMMIVTRRIPSLLRGSVEDREVSEDILILFDQDKTKRMLVYYIY